MNATKRLNIYLNPADLAILNRAREDLGVRADTEIVRAALRALARERGYSFESLTAAIMIPRPETHT